MKKWGHLSSFHVPLLNKSKKVQFLQFCAELSKKFRSIKTISIYASGISCYAFSENGIAYCSMTYCFGYTGIPN